MRNPLPRRAGDLACWLLIVLPLAFYLPRLPDYGRMQYNDYYSVLRQLTEGEELKVDPIGIWTIRSNEHRVTLPALVYALNIRLTGGNNLGLSAFALSLMAVVFTLLYRRLPADVRRRAPPRAAFGFVLAVFCFTPVAAHNVVMGFSGTIWFLSNAFAVAAIAALCRGGAFWRVLLFGFLGAFSYSTNLSLWPALLAGALVLRAGHRKTLALAVATTLVLWLFVSFYRTPDQHPVPDAHDLTGHLRYLGIYFGTLWTKETSWACVLGWCGIAGSVAVQLLVWRRVEAAHRAPWLMLQLYGLGNAVGTTLGRSGLGADQALASRYATLAAFFWVGALVPLGLWIRKSGCRPAAVLALAGLLAAMTIGMYQRGYGVLRTYLSRAREQPLAELALIHGVRDDRILERSVTPLPSSVWRLYDYMKAQRHVPFDRRPSTGRTTVDADARPVRRIQGVLEMERRLAGGCRYRGWAFSESSAVAEVVLADAGGRVRGGLIVGRPRPELAAKLGPGAATSGWEGYAGVDCASVRLRPYVRLAAEDGFFPLRASAEVRRSRRANLQAGDR